MLGLCVLIPPVPEIRLRKQIMSFAVLRLFVLLPGQTRQLCQNCFFSHFSVKENYCAGKQAGRRMYQF